jgi:hypothetical protein
MHPVTRSRLRSARHRARVLLLSLAGALSGSVGSGSSGAADTPVQSAPKPAVAARAVAGDAPEAARAAAIVESGATGWMVGDALWDRPRSADIVRTLAPVRSAVAALHATAGATLVIRHAGGQNDGLRADELRHWLVALGVEPGRIAIAPSAGASLPGQPRGTLALEVAR